MTTQSGKIRLMLTLAGPFPTHRLTRISSFLIDQKKEKNA